MYKYVLLHNNSSRNLVVCKKHRYQIVNCGVTELPYNLSNLFLKFETLGLFPKTASKDNFGYHFILYREKITRIKSIHLNKLLNSLKLKFISFYKNPILKAGYDIDISVYALSGLSFL